MILGPVEIDEIKISYRDAKNKREQVIILSQLYAVTIQQIVDITGDLTYISARPKGKLNTEARATRDAACKYCYDNKMNDRETSEYIGCSQSVVTKWRLDNLLPSVFSLYHTANAARQKQYRERKLKKITENKCLQRH